MRYRSFSAPELQGIAGGPLPGKNVASSLLDDRSIIRLIVKVMRFNRSGLQVVEFIYILISQAQFPPFRRDYSPGGFIHRAFNCPARCEACPGALIWFRLAQEIEQSRKEVDMAHRLRNSQALALAR